MFYSMLFQPHQNLNGVPNFDFDTKVSIYENRRKRRVKQKINSFSCCEKGGKTQFLLQIITEVIFHPRLNCLSSFYIIWFHL